MIRHLVAVKYLSRREMGSCCLLIRSNDLPFMPIKAVAESVGLAGNQRRFTVVLDSKRRCKTASQLTWAKWQLVEASASQMCPAVRNQNHSYPPANSYPMLYQTLVAVSTALVQDLTLAQSLAQQPS